MLRPKGMKLGEMLREAGLIDEFQLKSALSYQRNCGGRLGSACIAMKYISEDTLLDFLAEQLKFMRIDLTQRRPTLEALSCLPKDKARELNVVPVARKEHGGVSYLLVAMNDPTNLDLVDELQAMTNCRIRPALDTLASIREAIDSYYEELPQDDAENLSQLLDEMLEGSNSAQAPARSASTSVPPVAKSGQERLQQLIDLLVRKGVLSAQEAERL
jgi:hypothetical protein